MDQILTFILNASFVLIIATAFDVIFCKCASYSNIKA